MATFNGVVQVPVKYKGKEFKAPFLLFTGWTIEERRAYAADLRKLRIRWEQWGTPLCELAEDLVLRGEITGCSKSVLRKTMEHITGTYLPGHVSRQTELEYSTCKAFRGQWLDMQIGMVDVPDMGIE